MCIGAMKEECFLLQVPPLHKMVVNHDMHRPLTGHRLAPRRDRSRCDALSCHIRGPHKTLIDVHMCIGAMEEECFLLQVPRLHKMDVNHDMHKPLTHLHLETEVDVMHFLAI